MYAPFMCISVFLLCVASCRTVIVFHYLPQFLSGVILLVTNHTSFSRGDINSTVKKKQPLGFDKGFSIDVTCSMDSNGQRLRTRHCKGTQGRAQASPAAPAPRTAPHQAVLARRANHTVHEPCVLDRTGRRCISECIVLTDALDVCHL